MGERLFYTQGVTGSNPVKRTWSVARALRKRWQTIHRRLAQFGRAFGLHPKGRGFDPLIAYYSEGPWCLNPYSRGLAIAERLSLSIHTPVMELVYMLDLESSAFGIESSNLSGCTEAVSVSSNLTLVPLGTR